MRVTDTNDAARIEAGRSEPGKAQGARATSQTGQAGASPGGVEGANESGISKDRLHLSALASQIRAEDVESPERTAHLDRLAAEYAAGRYQADADEISSKLIDEALR
jgi:hypothetical protein